MTCWSGSLCKPRTMIRDHVSPGTEHRDGPREMFIAGVQLHREDSWGPWIILPVKAAGSCQEGTSNSRCITMRRAGLPSRVVVLFLYNKIHNDSTIRKCGDECKRTGKHLRQEEGVLRRENESGCKVRGVCFEERRNDRMDVWMNGWWHAGEVGVMERLNLRRTDFSSAEHSVRH